MTQIPLPTSVGETRNHPTTGAALKANPSLNGWDFVAQDPITADEAVENVGNFVDISLAPDPTTVGPLDQVTVDGVVYHAIDGQWAIDKAFKGEVNDLTKDTLSYKAPDFAAKLSVLYRDPNDNVQAYVPRAAADFAAWEALGATFAERYEPVGARKAELETTIPDALTASISKAPTVRAVREGLDLRIAKTDIGNATEVDAGTDPAKIVNVVELKRKLDALDISGDFIGSEATFVALPTTSSTGQVATNGDWVVLSEADGTNQRGVYLYDGTAYSFAFELGSDFVVATLADFSDPVRKSLAMTYAPELLDDRFLAKPMPLPATGATLEINNWYQGRLGDYTIPNPTSNTDFLIIENPSNLAGEATRATFTGKFSTSADGSIVSSAFSVSPNGRWHLYADMALDGGAGAWRIHSNRGLIIPLGPTDSNLLLTRNNDYALYNNSATEVVLRVPAVPSGRIRIRYDGLSSGGVRFEMENADAAPLAAGDTLAANQSFIFSVPAGAGPWVDAKGTTYLTGSSHIGSYVTGGTAPADLAAMTTAEFAQITVAANNISYNTGVNNGYSFGTELRGAEFSIEANITTGYWIIYPILLGTLNEVVYKANGDTAEVGVLNVAPDNLTLLQPTAVAGGKYETISSTGENPQHFHANEAADAWILADNPAQEQDVLPEWAAAQDYTVANTRVVGIAPVGATGVDVGKPYTLRPKADLTSGATLDSAEWDLYDVIGSYSINGSTTRTNEFNTIESLSFFEIESGTEANTRIIPEGLTKTFRLGVPDAQFQLNNYAGTQVTNTGGTSQDVIVEGPALLFHTLDGIMHKVTVSSMKASANSFAADMLDLATGDHGFTFDAANSDTTPTNTEKSIDAWGVRPAQANFDAIAQKNTYKVAEEGTIEVWIEKPISIAHTIQISETATPANQFSVNLNPDKSLTQPVGDPTNELTGIVATAKDNDESFVVVLSGTRPTEVDLKIWSLPIGEPATGFEDINYAFRVLSGSIPGVRKEQTYFAHTMPDPVNGVYEVDGSTVSDADLATWVTANPITGWSVSGNDVTMPDWRGRYLGASGGLGIGTSAGQLLASVNKAHTHSFIRGNNNDLHQYPRWGGQSVGAGGTFGTTQSSGSSYGRPETVAMPLCVVVGTARKWVPKEDVIDTTDSDLLKTQSGAFDVPDTGSGVSALLRVDFPEEFANKPEVAATYEWVYNAGDNSASRERTINVEGISTTSFFFRIVGERHTRDNIQWIAHDNTVKQKVGILPDAIMVDKTGLADGDSLVYDAANDQLVKGDPPAGTSTYSVVGGVHVHDYGDGFVKQWGRSAGVNSAVLPVTMKSIADCDLQLTVNSATVRTVHFNDSHSNNQINFVRSGGTGAAFTWSVFGEKA